MKHTIEKEIQTKKKKPNSIDKQINIAQETSRTNYLGKRNVNISKITIKINETKIKKKRTEIDVTLILTIDNIRLKTK